MIYVEKIITNPFQVNSFLVFDDNREAFLIDAGYYSANEKNALFNFVRDKELKIKGLLLTHGHVDHLFACSFIREKWNVPIYINVEDHFLISNAESFAGMFGLETSPIDIPEYELREDVELSLGNVLVRLFHVPGHSPGSMAFYFPENHLLFTGDVLFESSIGRTDLPGGNYQQLIEGISEKLLVLPGHTIVYPGHGNETTIENEIASNPFLKKFNS